ncbi:NADP dehydrogenase [ubiquinone] complex i, assembly factor 7-like [Plakobranchus ocellatus]|uniref:Protein arginine methyltransferase NDUFAF7 n=1 Tax=Plakobranchus ocellatus TaxID=259542 RepID=A0AAV4CS04_9GAST|nr:NADP dehydrogenase [ubiquinone] complex i, assembly factor 7-like [Plakobranchus ocellatus]
MHRDVFGSAGDFITSPEISQMFGEMLGVWVVNEWLNCYSGKAIQIVELGPGRGTLADDMLRVFSQFPEIASNISLHLVEVSPALSKLQVIKLVGEGDESNSEQKTLNSNSSENECEGPYRQEISKYGPQISWYRNLSDVPEGLSCYIAHEFLDALPIHKFHKTDKGWREVMIDVDPEKDGLRFVLAPSDTPASKAYLQVTSSEERKNLEVCPGAGIVVQEITKRIAKDGGFSLLADYGHSGEKGGTFRAFKNHKLHDPLEDPGTADLTSDVDFSYLKRFTSEAVSVFGPITQEKFLTNMGIGYRLQALLQSSKQEQWADLISGYKMLTAPEQMGERFKFFSITRKHDNDYVPAGFSDLHVKDDTANSS